MSNTGAKMAREKPAVKKSEHKQTAPERLDRRVQIALPVRITFWDKDKKPGLEMACTYDISPRGARITKLRCIKETGEIVAIERGRNKSFCRVVWIGEPNTELQGQIGLQTVESERAMFEGELKDLEAAYDPVAKDAPNRNAPSSYKGNRRARERFQLEGAAEVVKAGKNAPPLEGLLKDLSETGCQIVTKQTLAAGTEVKLALKVGHYKLNIKGLVKHQLDVGVGIEFTEIRKGDRQMLQHLLRKLEEKKLEEVFELEEKK